MFFYLYKKTIARLQLEMGVKAENKKADLYVLLHTYRIMFIANVLISFGLLFYITALSFVGGNIFFLMWHIQKNNIFIVLGILFLFIEFAVVIWEINLIKLSKQGKKLGDIELELIDKLSNIYLINPLVISYKDWKKIKEVSKNNYQAIRSRKVIQKCYESTFYIANVLKDSELKIMWIVNHGTNGEKFGHAVLVKGNYIYDTNRRKTYSKAKYLNFNQSEIYKEFSIEEYLLGGNSNKFIQEGICSGAIYQKLEEDWENLKVFCKQKGAIRCTND